MMCPILYRTARYTDFQCFYREAGPKGAPAILLLHGLPLCSRMFEPVLGRLADRLHLVAPDYPGLRQSDSINTA